MTTAPMPPADPVPTPEAAGPAGGRRSRRLLPLVPLLLGCGVLLTIVAREHTLYAYDQLAYWLRAAYLAAALKSNPFQAVAAVRGSMQDQDYNLLAAVVPAMALIFAGTGRIVFVGSMAVVYGGAAVLAVVGLVRRQSPVSPTPVALTLATLPVVLSPLLWRPLLDGYPDIGGVALATLAATVYLSPAGRRWRGLAVVGALLAVLVLFRRWYLFWAVGFGVAVVLDVVVRRRRDLRGMAAELATVIGVVAVSATIVGVALSGTLVLRMLGTDYNVKYEAYRTTSGYAESLADSATAVVREFGVLPAVLTGVAVVLGLLDRHGRRAVAVLTIASGIAILLLVRTNTLVPDDPHHTYLLLPAVAVALMLWAVRPASSRGRAAVLMLLIGLPAADYGWSLAAPRSEAAWPLLSRLRLQPRVRADLPQCVRLLDALSLRLVAAPGPVYVLAGNDVLNATEITGASLSLGRPMPASQFTGPSCEVDLRDGYPAMLLAARYVVVTDPPQLGLRAADEQAIDLPARQFLARDGVARAFVRWPQTFPLAGGVTVVVYERERPTTRPEAQALLDALRAAHPAHADVFQLPPHWPGSDATRP